MSYSKVEWTEATPITAARLDQMDTGIADALRRDGGTLTGRVIAADGQGGEVFLRIPDGKTPSALPSTYPLGVSTGRVTAANGWPITATLVTVRDFGSYTMQMLWPLNNSTVPPLWRVQSGGDAWLAFRQLVDTQGATFTGGLTAAGLTSTANVVAQGNLIDVAARIRLLESSAIAYYQVGTGGSDTTGRLRVSRRGTTTGELDWMEVYAGAFRYNGAAVARIATGTYTGNSAGRRLIATPFFPAFVVVSWTDPNLDAGVSAYSGARFGNSVGGIRARAFFGATGEQSDARRPEIAVNGFHVNGAETNELNRSGQTYTYTAIA
jgi:hypothetical protein